MGIESRIEETGFHMNWEKETIARNLMNCYFINKNGSCLCIELWLAMKNRFVTIILSARNYEYIPDIITSQQNIREKIYCAFGGIGVIYYYELLQPSQTINAKRYWWQLFNLNKAFKEKCAQYAKTHDKIILLHNKKMTRLYIAKLVQEILKALG